MKNYLIIFFAMFANVLSAQHITLSKAEKTSDNTDRFFYQVNPLAANSEYLGEVEIQGFSKNDPEVFSQIYKKAKTIGANSFSLKQTENLDGKISFNPEHYYINLYYTASIPKEDNIIYILSSSSREQRIKLNNKTFTIQPRSYIKQDLQQTGTLSVTTGKLLGSKILLSPKDGQPVQYFQILPAGIRADHQGQGGLNLKSGDIILLEKSYAQFLSAIYQEQK